MFLIYRHHGCFLIFPSGIWFVAKISPNLAYVSYKVFLINHNECINSFNVENLENNCEFGVCDIRKDKPLPSSKREMTKYDHKATY